MIRFLVADTQNGRNIEQSATNLKICVQKLFYLISRHYMWKQVKLGMVVFLLRKYKIEKFFGLYTLSYYTNVQCIT